MESTIFYGYPYASARIQTGTNCSENKSTPARDLLRRIAPRILMVDEVHHLLAGSYREQRASLNLLKYLANDLQLGPPVRFV